MEFEVWHLLGVLAVLALIDSTSFGTLLIPVWLLVAPGRLRAARLLLYLSVVGAAYAVIGVMIWWLLRQFGQDLLSWFEAVQQQPVLLVVQVGLAVLLMWTSFRLDPLSTAGKERKRRRDEARQDAGHPSAADRLTRFRYRAVGDGATGSRGSLVMLALSAVGLEIITLLPYLAGLGLVAASEMSIVGSLSLVAFYCLVMLLPALVLLFARVVASSRLGSPLQRLEAFLNRHSAGLVSTVVFLVGLWLGLNALEGLGVM